MRSRYPQKSVISSPEKPRYIFLSISLKNSRLSSTIFLPRSVSSTELKRASSCFAVLLIRPCFASDFSDTARAEVPIELNGFYVVLTPPVELAPHIVIADLPSGEASIISQWRTGEWINVKLEAAYNGTSRSIGLTADESTLDDATVKCYIYNPGDPVGPNSVGRTAYASFFIGALNLRPDQKVEILVK